MFIKYVWINMYNLLYHIHMKNSIRLALAFENFPDSYHAIERYL